jgi:uncharacterized protein YbcI
LGILVTVATSEDTRQAGKTFLQLEIKFRNAHNESEKVLLGMKFMHLFCSIFCRVDIGTILFVFERNASSSSGYEFAECSK